jgi:hypothetical protein
MGSITLTISAAPHGERGCCDFIRRKYRKSAAVLWAHQERS